MNTEKKYGLSGKIQKSNVLHALHFSVILFFENQE